MFDSLKALSLITMTSLLFACSSPNNASVYNQQNTSESKKQNVVMIVIDDLRPVIGVYGDKRAHTPNIDALAQQGVTFTKAYANVPVCGASRASMMTSIRPTPTRFVDYKAMAEKDAPGAKSLAQVLKESGYYTMGIGKIFHKGQDLAEESWSEPIQHSGLPHGTTLNPESDNYRKSNKSDPKKKSKGPFYEIADAANEDYPDGKVKEKALIALEKLSKSEQPFFLSVGFIRPHLPFNAPKHYYDLHPKSKFPPFFHRQHPKDAPLSLKSSGEIKTYHFKDYKYNSDAFHTASQRGYYASVSYIDALVGDITEKIDQLGLNENTTIVLVSDHGFNLGEHNFWTKHNMLDTALRIPLIVKGPTTAKNQQSNALIELIDIFPTVTELAQVTTPKQVIGESFVSVLKQPSLKHKNYLYSRFKPADSIINERFIFTSYKTESGDREEMLFDLINDPHETVNVVNQPAYKQQAQQMRKRLTACMQAQDCQTD